MTVCTDCTNKAPSHVDISNPIDNPPNLGSFQDCEICRKQFVLLNPEASFVWQQEKGYLYKE